MKKVILSVTVFFIISSAFFAQNRGTELLELAKSHMASERFGEAIDLLNKYISQHPQEAEGYYLRGISYEKRLQYPYAALDLKRAVKLNSKNAKYKNALDRVTKVWYAQLRKRIEGYKREIAIDPSIAKNYLEIGKSYRQMEEFNLAEKWYDKYLQHDDNASADEIIRYTEILAYTKHIKKGQTILKKWVERYPKDWRLWSRYGTFSLWLGERKVAEHAFQTALGFKPYFQEALDGLDKARKMAYVTDYAPRSLEKEFVVDRYYRLVKKHPENKKYLFRLIKELLKRKRYEEAYQLVLNKENQFADDPDFNKVYDKVISTREQAYQKEINKNLKRLKRNPHNTKAIKKLVQYYQNLQDYNSALDILKQFFEKYPNDKNKTLRYSYAKIAAWNKDFDLAGKLLDDLLSDYPDNLKYKLMRAEILIWTNQDIDRADNYLQQVLAKEPDNVEALIAAGSLELLHQDPEKAQVFADKVKSIDPNNDDLGELQTQIDLLKQRMEQEKLQRILDEGRSYVLDSNCAEALPYYEEYLQKAQPNDLIKKEYGDVLFCAGDYEDALQQYDEVLQNGYMYEAALQKAKVYFTMGDSLDALYQFKEVVKEDSSEFEPRLYLGDTYVKIGAYDSARAVYDTLKTWDLDSTQLAQVEMRYKWIPVTGLIGIIQSFPTSIGFSPTVSFYSDNIHFSMLNYGGSLEFGALSWLSLGVGINKFTLSSQYGFRDFVLLKFSLFAHYWKYFSGSLSFGSMKTAGYNPFGDMEARIRFEKKKNYMAEGYYLKRDAGLLLFSPGLINSVWSVESPRIYSSLYRMKGYFYHKSGIRIRSHFDYISISDGNEGNYFQFRMGKQYDSLEVGYEYYYANFKYDISLYQDSTVLASNKPYYYSPQNFYTHSVYAEYIMQNDKDLSIKIGGKLGYAPSSGFMIFEGYGKVVYKPIETLTVTAQLGAGNSTRDVSNYRSLSGVISAYWNIYP
jgi:tetratricopeptide (TPR) repeat protein